MTDQPRPVLSQVRPHTVMIADQLWIELHARAQREGTSISKLINEAIQHLLLIAREDEPDGTG